MALADLLDITFVEIGKIKIGGKGAAKQSRSGGTYRTPEKYDHFVITTLFRDKSTENFLLDEPLMEALKDHADKDGKLRSIPVLFGSNNIEEVMQTSYTWYIGKNCGARADGQTITFWNDPKTGQRLPEPQQYKWHADYLNLTDPTYRGNEPKKLLKRFTTLNCMIASPAARFGGFYRFRTTSEITSRQLYGSLMHFAGPRGLCPGTLKGLPFRLVVRPMPVAPNGQPSIVHVVHVEYMHSDLKALQAAAQEQRKLELEGIQMVVQAEQQYRQLLAAQVDEPDEDLIDDEELPMLPMPGRQPSQAEKEAAVLAEIEKAIAEAKDLDSLLKTFWAGDRFKKELWPVLDDEQRNAVIDMKDKRKAELIEAAKKPAAPPQSSEPPEDVQDAEAEPVKSSEPPPDETAAPANTAKAGKSIVAEIERLCVERGGSWNDFRAKHGIAATRVKDLTADEALKIHAMLKEGGAA